MQDFLDGPVGAHLIKRVTYNPETGEHVATDDLYDLADPMMVRRHLPEEVSNIRTEYHYVKDYLEDKMWTGSTIFKLKTMDPCEQEKPY